MISRKQESIHETGGMQKRFGLFYLLVGAIAILTLSGQTAAQQPETKYSVLYNFCSQPNCTDGRYPNAGVIRDEAGKPLWHNSSGW